MLIECGVRHKEPRIQGGNMKVRFEGYSEPAVNGAWSFCRLTQPSRLHGANGVRAGADGRVYVAQVAGSQVSAVDVDSGEVEIISRMGSEIVAPDDLVFDAHGNMFLTEITEDRVSILTPRGESRVIQDGIVCANPITIYQGRLIVGECRPGGRIMELDLNGGEARIILENAPMPNAFEVGPDGKLYAPMMGVNEIWRIDLTSGAFEVVASNLGVPDSVKFSSSGDIVSTQVASGQVLTINPMTGEQKLLAQLAPGLDNSTFIGDRLFVSSIDGSLTEVAQDGTVKPLVKQGLQWPLGLAVRPDGQIFVADGAFSYLLREGEPLQQAGFLFFPGYPGYTRGVAYANEGAWWVTTSNGQVAKTWPESMRSEVVCDGYDRLMGISATPDGHFVFAEFGTGTIYGCRNGSVEVLARDLSGPTGVAVAADGTIYVAEQDAGRVSVVRGGNAFTVAEDFALPQGIACSGDILYVADAARHCIEACNVVSGERVVVAADLPIGAPPGVEPKLLKAIGDMAGPMLSFTGLCIATDGSLYIAGDTEGSVLKLSPKY